MGERTRGTLWCGRALLLAALLLGIVTMHTLGHPSTEPAPSAPARMAAPHGTGPHGVPPQHASPHEAGPHGAGAPEVAAHDAVSRAAAPPVTAPGDSSHGDHGMDMDPMSVCLAVLGVWTMAALLGAAVVFALRARTFDLLAPRRARILRALLPLPPPSTSVRLARLSLLRV